MKSTYGRKHEARDLFTYPFRFIIYIFPRCGWFITFICVLISTFSVAWEYSLFVNCGPGRLIFESAARIWGMLLQLLGIAVVALGIRQNAKLFNRPSQLAGVFRMLREGPRLFQRPTSTTVDVEEIAFMEDSYEVSSTYAKHGEGLEGRVKLRERLVEQLTQETAACNQQIKVESRTRKEAVENEAKIRNSADAELGAKLDSAVAGGLELEVLGLYWLVVGTVVAGFATDLQRWTQPASITCAGI